MCFFFLILHDLAGVWEDMLPHKFVCLLSLIMIHVDTCLIFYVSISFRATFKINPASFAIVAIFLFISQHVNL